MNSHFVYECNSPLVTHEALKNSIIYKLKFVIGKEPYIATQREWLEAILLAARDRIVDRWMTTNRAEYSQQLKQVYYLSMEFLLGRSLSNTLISMNMYDDLVTVVTELGFDFEQLLEQETDPGLGNGGLGRLAACFLDSLATMNLPGCGYGIRYEYGMFRQTIRNGQQIECPDDWLAHGNPWEFPRTESRYQIQFEGHVIEEDGCQQWIKTNDIIAVAYDQIIPGYKTEATNTLRLWSAKASDEFDLQIFNDGEYYSAVKKKNESENVSRVLYPNDSTYSGKELRLKQEYFLVSASVQDILYRHWLVYETWDNLADKVSIHLNDTHPVLAIPELIRILIDKHQVSWQDAFSLANKIFSYTNHTLMSEALETWPVEMIRKILPRHLQIIYQINDDFLQQVIQQFPHDYELPRRVSIINEDYGQQVRMAWLAAIVCHKVNGVSKLHSQLMVDALFADFALIFPNKFCNITNGVTPRRWLAVANPELTEMIEENIGQQWLTDLPLLDELKQWADYPQFLDKLRQVKLRNKQKLAIFIAQTQGIVINPEALFDVQIKRIHEYKRQLLNLMHVITHYNRILANPSKNWVPRVVIFSGKAASSYSAAKKIIHLINDVAKVINNDERIGDRLKIVFIPDYGVSLAQKIIPATDLSEQISLAGTEASGTGNMKFALNGALTIGTLDGANVEIREHVGHENIFIFGHTIEEVKQIKQNYYYPRWYYDNDAELKQVIDQINDGYFKPDAPNFYHDLTNSLLDGGDQYLLFADYRSYINTQEQVNKLYQDPLAWQSKVTQNICNMGFFSSDRTIKEYATQIWNIKPINL
ncbi:glycogen/starch/alpha-glucan family phosphorylase [Providencia stuartii]|uniref:glycogen/starch/alpha-glucan family phosphorylase n=1 Tax=Providencia TaxID=586 RepID=UPI00293FB90A|nr:glycogen/starch/alpha-glucan family phosphorylase [Providencia sp. 2023EL-00965]ELR5299666.1 glycogen/starch/alpha-glucan family phosphorylase [Providencia stuartii]MDW7588563.1 glycogen/starch/alpha-glucan family phosphorylase [Providencia sp. 2023EL-00965]